MRSDVPPLKAVQLVSSAMEVLTGLQKGARMPRKRYSSEQIILHLREAEVELAKGPTTAGVCRKSGIAEQTYYRWRKAYGGLRVDQVRRLKDLERENGRLK